jgi:hypothetical protein
LLEEPHLTTITAAVMPPAAGVDSRSHVRLIWELERAGRCTRCIAVSHAHGCELRIEGDGGSVVWREMFADELALNARANDGRERLLAVGWRDCPVSSVLPGPAAPSDDEEFGFLDSPLTPAARFEWSEDQFRLEPALTAPPMLFSPKCPACGSMNVFASGTVAFAAFRQLWLCAECKHTWRSVRWSKVLLVVLCTIALVIMLVMV